MPGFCSPTPTRSPAATSAVRGAPWPARGRSVVPRVTTPPSRARSTASATSTPYPTAPDAAMTGFWRTSPRPRPTSRTTGRPPYRSVEGAVGAGDAEAAGSRAPRPAPGGVARAPPVAGRAGRMAGLRVRTVGVRRGPMPGTTLRRAFTGRLQARISGTRTGRASRPPGISRDGVPRQLVGGERRALATDALRDARRAGDRAAEARSGGAPDHLPGCDLEE